MCECVCACVCVRVCVRVRVRVYVCACVRGGRGGPFPSCIQAGWGRAASMLRTLLGAPGDVVHVAEGEDGEDVDVGGEHVPVRHAQQDGSISSNVNAY
jgi:hypothetical protein